MRFEYKYLELRMGVMKHSLVDLYTGDVIQLPGGNNYGFDLIETFNRLGNDRWELVSSHCTNMVYEYIFKRPTSQL